MDDQFFVFATAAVMVLYFLAHVASRKFDPFAPVWLFLLGYAQIYVIQALSYREWALDVRGKDLVQEANLRAFWALLWFLVVYQLGAVRAFVSVLPRPPRQWNPNSRRRETIRTAASLRPDSRLALVRYR